MGSVTLYWCAKLSHGEYDHYRGPVNHRRFATRWDSKESAVKRVRYLRSLGYYVRLVRVVRK